MKKKLILLFILTVLPIMTFAKPYYADYNTKNLKEVLTEEGIELKNKDYQENAKQVPIYLFRGHGCGFCHRLLEYLSSITVEYGDKFKVVSFEVWQDKNNKALFDKVAKVTEVANNGVPYYIIGEQVFTGYTEEYNDGIVEAIKNEYNNRSKDVFEKLADSEKKTADWETVKPILFGVFVMIALGTFASCMVSANNTKKVLEEIKKIKDAKVQLVKEKTAKEENKEVKKSSKKKEK